MTFLTPLIAGIAAAIAIPSLLILYFLKLRRRDMEVSTTLLWKKAIEDLQANAPFQKLRRNILLFLQLLALAAALFALAQPEISSDAVSGVRHVILIDASGSMQATDGDPDAAPGTPGEVTRLERAKQEAKELVDTLREPGLLGGEGDQAMVISFDTTAHPVQNFTTSKAALKAAIEAIEASDSSTSIKEAIKLAKAYSPRVTDLETIERIKRLGSVGPPAVIHIFSDGRLPDIGATADDPEAARTELTTEDQVMFHAVGQPETWNIGITAVRAERAIDEPGKLQIFVGLQSTAKEARTVDVELSIEGVMARVREATLAPATMSGPDPAAAGRAPEEPGEPREGEPPRVLADNERPREAPEQPTLRPSTGGVVFTMDRAEGGIVVARLRSRERDALPVDDIAYLSVPPAKRLAVALVTGGNLFLREVLEGLTLSRLQVLTPKEGQELFDDPRRAGEFDVFVVDRWLPTIKRRDGTTGPGLPPGRFLVFGAVPPPPVGMTVEGEGGESLVVDWRRDHPAMRAVSMDALIATKSPKVSVPEDSIAVVLAQGQHGPLIAEVADQQTRALICTFDVMGSTWPFDPGFVLYTAAGLIYLGNDGMAAGEVLRPGQTISQRLPAEARNVSLAFPDNTRADLVPSAEGAVVYGPVRDTGIYTISWEGAAQGSDVEVGGRVRRALAANLADPRESNIGSATALEVPGKEAVNAEQGGAASGLRKLWPYLLLFALLMVLVEWWVYNRKVML
ncbi:MAG: VWA domain-containing protein [Phycisphaerales bacterium]